MPPACLAWNSFASFLASFFLGMFVGAFLFSWISDRFGRRATFTWSMLIYSIAIFLTALQNSAVVIDVLRFIAGFGISVQLINNDSFISEITPRRWRGRYMAFSILIVLTSGPVALLLSWLLVPQTILGLSGWRWVVIAGALGGIIVWLIRGNIPESPRWLQSHGRHAEADAAMRRMEERVRAEPGANCRRPTTNTRSLRRRAARGPRCSVGRYLSRTIMLSLFQFCQTIAAFGFITWVPIMLVRQGFAIAHSLAFTAMITLLAPVGAALGLFFAERIERKWQLVGTAIGIGVFGLLFSQVRTDGLDPAVRRVGVAVCKLAGQHLPSLCGGTVSDAHPRPGRRLYVQLEQGQLDSGGYAVTFLLSVYGTAGVFTMIACAMAVIVLSVGILGTAE